MKIHLANHSDQGIGGGWSFLNNFQDALQDKVEFTDAEECDVFFISGATMVQRDEVVWAKENGKKVVLRVDNIPRNSRNRNTGTSRLSDFAELADLVVYQSEWAKDFVGGWLDIDGPVILNGVNQDIFKPEGDAVPRDGKPQYMYSRYSRDPTKNWEAAWYAFIMQHREEPDSHLWIVGRWGDKNKEYDFDFFDGARNAYKYWGVIDDPAWMAEILRGTDIFLYTYSNDACSNTLIEAISCGCQIIMLNEAISGGSPEILKAYEREGIGYFSHKRMAKEYMEHIIEIL